MTKTDSSSKFLSLKNETELLHEIKALRYMVGILMVNFVALSESTLSFEKGLVRRVAQLVQREKEERERKENKEQEKVSHTLLKEKEKKEKKEKEEKEKLCTITSLSFNSFTLRNKYYQALVREYGTNVVADACVVLDKLIGISKRSYSKPEVKLREICENFKMRDELIESYSYTSQRTRVVNYYSIDNVADARKYINSTPFYRRNIDKGCLYLKEKFKLDIPINEERECTSQQEVTPSSIVE